MMSDKKSDVLLFLGLTAVLVGYFSIWLPGPGAGLQLMGLETAEWLKFMGMGTNRNWFYLPPITLGLVNSSTMFFSRFFAEQEAEDQRMKNIVDEFTNHQ